MNFKKRRIRNNLNKIRKAFQNYQSNPSSDQQESALKKSINPDKLHNTFKYGSIGLGVAIIFGLFWLTISLVKSLDFGSLIFSFGKQLKSDGHGHTNFLLTGNGGAEHDGGNLTDTIMIASLDAEKKTVKMLSLPRDLYIEDKTTGGQRINKIYDTYLNKYKSSAKGMEKLADTLTQLTGIPIQYTVKVDFEGFVKIVDSLGGITVNVENAIHDPFFPLGESIQYQTFDISAGIHQLDGITALKYARSRKTTSDFDRAKRQQQIISAIKEKALSLNLLTDPSKLQKLYESVADSIETNLTVPEILELAKIAKEINRDQIDSRVISDDFTSCGGLLYTPNREYFAGAAVLLPAGNEFDETKRFASNYFYSNQTGLSPIQVLNGTKTSGLALNYLNRLSRDCLDVIYYGNATDRQQEKSVIYYQPDEQGQAPSAVKQIQDIINAPAISGIPPEYLETPKRAPAQIVLEIGADYKSITLPDPFDKLKYMEPIAPTPETTDGAEPITIRSNAESSGVNVPSIPSNKTNTINQSTPSSTKTPDKTISNSANTTKNTTKTQP